MIEYDAVIIGFGKAGKTLASELAKQGKRVAMIEKSPEMYGGTCINIACIPTKSLVYQSNQRENSNISKDDFYKNAIKKKDDLTSFLRDKNFHMLADQEKIKVYTGTATFIDDNYVLVQTDHDELKLTANKFYINTGSSPNIPPIKGIENSDFVYDSTTLQGLQELPENLIIIGGGFIALEFASIYANFGSKVTILERASTFLQNEDPDIAAEIKKTLEEKDITIKLDSQVHAIEDRDGAVVVSYQINEEKNAEAYGSAVLLATGRKPNTEGLGIDNTSINVDDQGAIIVDDTLKTTVNHIWALGDVNGGPQFTYISLDDFRIIKDQLFGNGTYTKKKRSNVPSSVFIDPVLSHIGLNEKRAKEKGIDYKVTTLSAAAIPRARIINETNGLLKALIDPRTNEILGCTLFCANSSEIINIVRIAMEAKLPYTFLRDTIYTHPSMSEALNDLFSQFE